MGIASPRLTVSVITKNSENRLARLLTDISDFADEILVGVDITSTDRTQEIAESHADIVYKFKHPGQLAPARLLPFKYATGDWILLLDDDESIEENFDLILPELLNNNLVTNYSFLRKTIVNLEPCEYVYQPPFFPDWQTRLFRNDKTLVWKPPHAHSGLYVMGPGEYEERASILHFEPIFCDAEQRKEKFAWYLESCSKDAVAEPYTHEESYYNLISTGLRRFTQPRKPSTASARNKAALDSQVNELSLNDLPKWRSEILKVDLSKVAKCGELLLAAITVKNTGDLAWMPGSSAHRDTQINLSYHLYSHDGALISFENERCHVPRSVPVNAEATFIMGLCAPAIKGDYILEWDMLSERECWFASNGSKMLRSELSVSN